MLISPSDHHALISAAKNILSDSKALDINEQECDFKDRSNGRTVHTTLTGGIPAVVYCGPRYRDEWVVSIALWPTTNAAQHMATGNANERAGQVFAYGWVNRWEFDGRSFGIERFSGARGHVDAQRKSQISDALLKHSGLA